MIQKYLFGTILLFMPFGLFAQTNFAGKWEGVLTQKDGKISNTYFFALDFKQVGDSIFGISSIAIEGTLNRANMRLVGKILDINEISFKELEIIKEKLVVKDAYWCIKTYTLEYDQRKETLSGDWTAGICTPGRLSVKRIVEKTPNSPKTADTIKVSLPEGYLGMDEIKKKTENHENILGKKIVLENVYFEHSKSLLKAESYRTLKDLSSLLKEIPNLNIKINGHTDNVGDQRLNKRLSSLRALTVMNYLINSGIKESRLKYEGFGSQKPISPNDTEQNKRKNRRVEFEIVE